MGLMQRLEPRRFSYRPRYLQPEKEKRIRFSRITRYDPHTRSRMPWIYLALFILVMAIIFILGGVRHPPRPPALTADDAVGVAGEVSGER